jgi:hypothetical protein
MVYSHTVPSSLELIRQEALTLINKAMAKRSRPSVEHYMICLLSAIDTWETKETTRYVAYEGIFCHVYGLPPANEIELTASSFQSQNQADNEGKVCTFIQNLITNSYDEYGHIYLQNDWKSYLPDIRSMTYIQQWALSCSALSAVGLFLYVVYLHRTISGAKYAWHPNKKNRRTAYGLPGQSVEMHRMHSGIIQGRSRSELPDGAVFA